MQNIISSKAHEDIDDIYQNLSFISFNYAERIVNKIYSVIDTIQYFPYIGRYVPEIPNKNYRERLYKSYRIIYYISERRKTIYIQYIFCSRQNAKTFFNLNSKDF